MIELTGYTDKHEYTNKHGVKSVVYLMDCMTAMAQMGDKEFSLAVCDPPYGIGMDNQRVRVKPNRPNTYARSGNAQYKESSWDTHIPDEAYFIEIRRIALNQIIWGANYFCQHLPNGFGWIYWDKQMGEGNGFSTGEFAFQSIQRRSNFFSEPSMRVAGTRIHPTQKPVALYDWIFHNYAKANDTILDTHLGSGSSRIAADKHNLPFLGTETDPDYFRDHCKRFDRYTSQLTLF